MGTDDGGVGSFGTGDDASNSGTLAAHIEQNRVTVTIVTLSCKGPCADVVAVATGGHAPYSFAWDDGSTGPARHLCPTLTTKNQVKVTDTGTSGEFARAGQTVEVSLTADVIACPDGGATVMGPCESAAASFVPSGLNPAGAWSYGRSATLGAAFVRYPDFIPATGMADAGSVGWVGVVQWMDLSLGTLSGPVPDIVYNASAVPQHPPSGIGSAWTLQPGQATMGCTPTTRWLSTPECAGPRATAGRPPRPVKEMPSARSGWA